MNITWNRHSSKRCRINLLFFQTFLKFLLLFSSFQDSGKFLNKQFLMFHSLKTTFNFNLKKYLFKWYRDIFCKFRKKTFFVKLKIKSCSILKAGTRLSKYWTVFQQSMDVFFQSKQNGIKVKQLNKYVILYAIQRGIKFILKSCLVRANWLKAAKYYYN